MRSVVCALWLLASAPAWCEDIRDVLERSQRTRLEALPLAESHGERALLVRASFDRVVRASGLTEAVELRIVRGGAVAETFHGRVVVANESLADLPESERTFILAHELGHVAMGHWSQLGQLYLRHVPGAVTPETTDPIAGALGRDASALSHRHELDADAFSLHAMRSLGHSLEDAFSAFRRMGLMRDTATHPGTRKRMASLREVEDAPTTTARFEPAW